jgi:hypothetical protein
MKEDFHLKIEKQIEELIDLDPELADDFLSMMHLLIQKKIDDCERGFNSDSNNFELDNAINNFEKKYGLNQ